MTVDAFKPFKFAGEQFLAIPRDGGNVQIVSQQGDNYGAWMSVESFKKHMMPGIAVSICFPPLGKCAISVRVLS